ncbi:MAG: TraR/DksA family transcriptional regulator [Pseudomonadales bacterium]
MAENKLDLQQIKLQLLELREALVSAQETGDQAAKTVELDQTKVGRLSRMDALQAQAMSQAGVERREAQLREISVALARMESGDYGFCAQCDEPIAVARLAANPASSLCLQCASAAERR